MKRQTHSVSLAVVYCLVSFCTSSLAVPTVVQEAGGSSDNTLWKGSSMDKVVQELKVECTDKNDGVACIKFKVLHLLDEALRKDSFQVIFTFLNRVVLQTALPYLRKKEKE